MSSHQPAQRPGGLQPAWSAWRVVVWFGVISLAGDVIYEGARSITGPFLASLGASALVVGAVTGAGEAAALVLRLVSGPYADRSGNYWPLTIVGYAMTAVCVPLMAVAPFLGAAGLAFGASMVLLERTGKAVRSPAKSALLAHATHAVGRGRGFAVHKALDQVGAFLGPLVVAGVIALTARTWAGLAVLAVPGAVVMALLLVMRRRVPDLSVYDEVGPEVRSVPAADRIEHPTRLPARFYLFAASVSAGTLGLMTFGVIGYHLVDTGLARPAMVPIWYAVAMAVEAVAALVTGFAYDEVGGRVLLALPLLVAVVPLLTLADQVLWVAAGLVAWGAATGVQDSTVKALVADLVPRPRLATAYGVFAAFQGAAALGGGALAGWLYDRDQVALLVGFVALCQAASLALLLAVLRRTRSVVE